MKTFSYKGYRATGQAAQGIVEALDFKDAREKLSQQGVFSHEVNVAGSHSSLTKKSVVNLDVRASLYRELSALLLAGLPMSHALEMMVTSSQFNKFQTTMASVRDAIHEGAEFSEAWQKALPGISAYEVAALSVGERAGSLDSVLQQLAEFLEEQQQLKEKVQSAMLYPTIVLVLAVVVGVVMLGFVLPHFGKFLAEARVELPFLTKVMLGLGDWVGRLALPVGCLIGVLGWLGYRKVKQDVVFARRVDRTIFRLPLIGALYGKLCCLRFARTLSMLLKGGVGLVEGLPLAGRATGSRWTAYLVERETERVRHGQSLADTIKHVPTLNEELQGWIHAGEASGKLERMLSHAALRSQRQWDKGVGRLVGILEPALVVTVGLFVLVLAWSVLGPVMQFNSVLK